MKEKNIKTILDEYGFDTNEFDFLEGDFISEYLKDKKFVYFYYPYYDEYGLFVYDGQSIYELNTTKDEENDEKISIVEHTIFGETFEISKESERYDILCVLKEDLSIFFLNNKKYRIKYLFKNISN